VVFGRTSCFARQRADPYISLERKTIIVGARLRFCGGQSWFIVQVCSATAEGVMQWTYGRKRDHTLSIWLRHLSETICPFELAEIPVMHDRSEFPFHSEWNTSRFGRQSVRKISWFDMCNSEMISLSQHKERT
jgi:hypothetical protein